MANLMYLNSVHLNYLEPLLKWRVLDLESLRKECLRAPKYKNFHRIIRTLERQKILDGYRDPFNRKKYVYLSSFGESQLSLDENPTALSKETLIHDIKVTEFSKAMVELGWITDAELEHRIHDKRNFQTVYKIIPDAVLHGTRNNVNFKIALELELTRKNNQRVMEKANQYLQGSQFNYVLYLFSKKSLLEKYIEVIKERVGDKGLERFMFFSNETLDVDKANIINWEGVFKGKQMNFGELFNKP